MTQTRSDERSIGELVSDATAQMQKLVKAEIALAKAELTNDAKRVGIGAGMFGAAGFFGYVALLFLSVAAGFGIHKLGLGLGWSFLIVGGFYLVCAAILGLVGKANLSKMTKAARTKQTMRDNATWAKSLKQEMSSPPELPAAQQQGAVQQPPSIGPRQG